MNPTDTTLDRSSQPQQLLAAFDAELGQVILSGTAPGAAGAFEVSPAPGVACSLDAVSGQIFEVVLQQAATPERNGAAALALGWLVGKDLAERLCRLDRPGEELVVEVPADRRRVLQRLGLLEEAELTDPVAPGSPLFLAEAAALAHNAGLRLLSERYAAAAAPPLAKLLDGERWLLGDSEILGVTQVVSALAERSTPTDVDLLRRFAEEATTGTLERRIDEIVREAGLVAPAGLPGYEPASATLAEVHATLAFSAIYPDLLPPGTFLFSEDPRGDLSLLADSNTLVVTARLAPGADTRQVESCYVRLVDPSAHQVIASAAMRVEPERSKLAVARLELSEVGGRNFGVEVVDDPDEPVAGPSLQHLRRAIRFGRCALRAERGHFALHSDWDQAHWRDTARDLWDNTAGEWALAGDTPRAAIADALAVSEPGDVDDWTRPLRSLSPATQHPFLAERLGLKATTTS